MKSDLSLAFVIPLYRSEATISDVVEKIAALGIDWEAVLINDSSPDRVEESVKNLIQKYPERITYLRLSKNGGQHNAILQGMHKVTKNYVATIDDDGQNDPADCVMLAHKLIETDQDVMYGAFKNKHHAGLRNLASWLNRMVSRLAIGNKRGVPVTNVRVMTKDTAHILAESYNYFPYIDGMIFSFTDRIGYEYIDHYERVAGTSGYNYRKLMRLWMNHLIGYSTFLPRFVTMCCFAVSVIALLLGVAYFAVTINNPNRPEGWLSIYLTITTLFSFLFLFLGLLAEYIGRLYMINNRNKQKLISYHYEHPNK